MQTMVFQVSAKTARLIGRENISDVDGAILELVKNGYDADAECVCIKFINPFNEIPKTLTYTDVNIFFANNEALLNEFYIVKDGIYVLNDGSVDLKRLERFIYSLCHIIVVDNGNGMSRDILESAWMNIGTSDKEANIYSPKKKRIKTGAKGIGRFALDKLSLATQVLTRYEDEPVYSWEIDWTQFDNAVLLNQVEAKLQVCEDEFERLVEQFLQKDFNLVKEFSWKTGTIIHLTPVREFWDEKLYAKVNKNLKNINPLGNVDRFEVVVRNAMQPQFNYRTENEGITRDDYDYMIEARFDGKGYVTLDVDRNEIDITKNQVEIELSSTDKIVCDLKEFWGRKTFSVEGYHREDFNGRKHFLFTLKEILEKPQGDLERYNRTGPFSVKLYYLKNQKSTVEIVRDFKSRSRKRLLKNFSGVKIYRDGFKVRPYGDVGQFYDWLNMSERVQKSPAAASHHEGYWRVSPNQLIGSVTISRIDNPRLEDNANREGMTLNREYDYFIEIIQGILAKFEYDRQYVLREYATWVRGIKKKYQDKAQAVYEEVQQERRERNNSNSDEDTNAYNASHKTNFSEDDLKEAVLTFGQEKENNTTTEQLISILSAAGVMTQTFSHEITRIGTQLGSRGQHLKESINRILEYKPYSGDEDFNPYVMLQELDDTDELLAEWVNLIMASVSKKSFEAKAVRLQDFINRIIQLWQPLLNKKIIRILPVIAEDGIELNLPEVDLHLLFNNFLLNSAYFLEEAQNERLITIALYEKDGRVYLDMMNNGPSLDDRYIQNPDITLNARVSSKDNGTGLGLWFAREAVERNEGELHVIPINEGYKLQASWIL